jgi:hypothetical protein
MTFDACPYNAILIIIVLHGVKCLLFYWETSEHASSARNMQMNKEKLDKPLGQETQTVNNQPVGYFK